MAKAVGITRRAYVAYEQDEARPRKRETYTKLATALGCNINYLLVEDSAVLGAVAGLTAMGVALAAIPGPIGVAVALGTLLGIKKSVLNLKKEEALFYNNDMLLQYENRQKLFKATALGIIYSALASKAITCQPGIIQSLDSIGVHPDEFVTITGQDIDNWWFSFWAKDNELDSRVIISPMDRAEVLFSRFSTASSDSKRKVSIVVDDDELFNALCKFKDHNSYRGNISVILIDIENVRVLKEKLVAFYYADDPDEMLMII
jgi:transcriptional regulator with XRE-family HTH domain